jgi:arylsulfatase A-like enzyme
MPNTSNQSDRGARGGSRSSVLPIALALLCGGCGGSASSSLPPGGHLFDLAPTAVELPRPVLPEELFDALAHGEVRVAGERVEPSSWRLLERDGEELHLRAPTRFPFLGSPRLVSRAEADDPDMGRVLAPGEEPVLDPHAVVLSADGVEIVRHQDAESVPSFRFCYAAPAAAVLEALVGRLPDASLFEAPVPLELSQGARPVAYAPAPSRVVWSELEVPRDGQLLFGFGLLQLRYRPGPSGIELGRLESEEWRAEGRFRFRIVALRDGAEGEVLFERELGGDRADRFLDGRADLAEYAGERIGLAFQTEALDADAPRHLLPFWSEPTLDAPADDERPSVIVLLLDTVRADRIGCFGGDRGNTPNIDALAERGLVFTDATAAAPFTKTSHAAMFSSMYPTQLELGDDKRLPDDIRTLAEVLRAEGYQTHAVSEGYFVHPRWGLAQGFDSFTIMPQNIERTYEEALARLSVIRGSTFAFVQTYEAHSPYRPHPKQRRALVRPYSGPLPEVVDHYAYRALGDSVNEEDARYMRDLYDAEIARVDEWVGRLLSSLEREGRLEHTLVILTSDHGEEFMDHGGFGHGHSVYQELVHVPLIVYQKGRFEHEVIDRPVHGVDLAPSILDALGIQAPAEWVGTPYWSTDGESHRPILTSYHDRDRGREVDAVRSGSMKIIRYPESADGERPEKVSIYDLARDPAETADLAEGELARTAGEHVRRELGRYPPIEGGAQAVDLSEELADALRDLGYLGSD